jgi:hypothetical protein
LPPTLLAADTVNESSEITDNITLDQPTSHPTKVADTGATGIFLRRTDVNGTISVVQQTTTPQAVMLPNGDLIHSTGIATLHIPDTDIFLPVHVFDDDVLHISLCGIFPFTEVGCKVIFENTAITVMYRNRIIMTGTKRPTDKLWPMPLPSMSATNPGTATHTAYLMVRNENNKDFVAFTHACLGSPVQSTFEQAVGRGWLNGISGLTLS